MRIVVADTSPINYLVLIGNVDVLKCLFDQVLIPEAVARELCAIATPEEVRMWMNSLPNWVTVQKVAGPEISTLGKGETEAIALAKQVNAFAVVVDDLEARVAAEECGLRVVGTVGILEAAAKKNLISLQVAFQKLKETNFFIAPAVLKAALERDAAFKKIT